MKTRLLIPASLILALSACGQSGEEAASTDTAATETAMESEAPAEATETVALTGEEVFKRCMACHKADAGAPSGIGPNLHGVVGRKVAGVDGYNYSKAMMEKGGTWDEATLDEFLAAPMKTVPGTKMGFAGVTNDDERKALIGYLAEQK